MQSIQVRLFAFLSLVFALVLGLSLHFSAEGERVLVEELVSARARDTADFYFDSINTMMLTGTMAQRELIRKKVLLQPNILDARIVRAPAVTEVFGPGNPEQKPVDEHDRRALAGEAYLHIGEQDGRRVLTLVQPMRAGKDERGVNCLACHTVKEGTVLGAVRVSYDLEPLDRKVSRNLFVSGSINTAIAVAGLLLVGLAMRRWLFDRLHVLGAAFERIRSESDLSAQVPVKGGGEVDRLARHFNAMMRQFQQTMGRVGSSNSQLGDSAGKLQQTSDEMRRAVDDESQAVDQLAERIEKMAQLAEQVRSRASNAVEASGTTKARASDAQGMTKGTIDGIRSMHERIQEAAAIIANLDQHSQNVSKVLDVIKGIAEQTNLLALNAAIEAARAGEAGRGFAVVADEVRALASRTQQSAGEIEQMIAALVAETDRAVAGMEVASRQASEGVQRSREAIDALRDISERVQQIHRDNERVLQVSETQMQSGQEALEQLQRLQQLTEVVEKDAGLSSEVSQELYALYKKLEQDLGRFRF